MGESVYMQVCMNTGNTWVGISTYVVSELVVLTCV